MKRIAVVLAVLVFLGSASGLDKRTFTTKTQNWNGYGDTSGVTDFDTDSLKYSKWYDLGRFEDIGCALKVDDSGSAGFGSDSIVIAWGYQLGIPIYDSAGTKDTLAWIRVELDSMLTDSLGKMKGASVDSAGNLVRFMQDVDTASVSGWAVQWSWFVPEWAPLIRYYAQGGTGNNKSEALELVFDHKRRHNLPVGGNK